MSRVNKILPVVLGIFILITILIYINFFQKRISKIPQIPTGKTQEPAQEAPDYPRLSTVTTNLEVPWALAFLPDGSMLVTERPGRVRLIDKEGKLLLTSVAQLLDVKPIGEGGLHGITIHPDFSNNKFVYLYYTYGESGNQTLNQVVRFKFENNTLLDRTVILDKIPGAPNHDGGRIKFGPDKLLYITTGDAQNPSLAQDTNSLAGKILRITDDGKPAPNNPFGNNVLSYGHRNPQGITWDNYGKLWAVEHGQSATDELNLIEVGKNYGWPKIRGDQKQNGLENPILHSGSDTWAPSGAAYLNGSVFFAGLRGQALYQASMDSKGVTLTEHLKGEIGRIREVVVGPDNLLYITTSNRDGRGIPDSEDDRVIRVNPEKL